MSKQCIFTSVDEMERSYICDRTLLQPTNGNVWKFAAYLLSTVLKYYKRAAGEAEDFLRAWFQDKTLLLFKPALEHLVLPVQKKYLTKKRGKRVFAWAARPKKIQPKMNFWEDLDKSVILG